MSIHELLTVNYFNISDKLNPFVLKVLFASEVLGKSILTHLKILRKY